MFKKKFYFLIGLITLFASNAQAIFINENLKAYVGANIGYTHLNTQLRNRLTTNRNGLVLPMDSSINKTKRKDGFMGELLLGMRYAYNTWIAGFEIAASLDSHKIDHNFFHINSNGGFSQTAKISVNRKYAIVPALVFGKQLSQSWLAFVKLGVGFSTYKINFKNVEDNQTFMSTQNTIGFVPSAGMEYGINEKFSCVGTVTYERYKRFSKSKSIIPNDPDFKDQNYIKIKPELVSFKIGLLFKI